MPSTRAHAAVVTFALLASHCHDGGAPGSAKLAVCHDWENTVEQRLAAGQLATARDALKSVRTTCGYEALDNRAAAAEENTRLIALELRVRQKERAAAESESASANATAGTPPAAAPTVARLSPSERARALAGIEELRLIIGRQMTAQGQESEQGCQTRLDAEWPRIKAAETKVGLAVMGVGDSNRGVRTRFATVPRFRESTPSDLVAGCMGCWTADDRVAMREDQQCANASIALDDVAEAWNAVK